MYWALAIVMALPPGAGAVGAMEAAAPAVKQDESLELARWKRRNAALFAGLGVSIGALIAGIAVVATQADRGYSDCFDYECGSDFRPGVYVVGGVLTAAGATALPAIAITLGQHRGNRPRVTALGPTSLRVKF